MVNINTMNFNTNITNGRASERHNTFPPKRVPVIRVSEWKRLLHSLAPKYTSNDTRRRLNWTTHRFQLDESEWNLAFNAPSFRDVLKSSLIFFFFSYWRSGNLKQTRKNQQSCTKLIYEFQIFSRSLSLSLALVSIIFIFQKGFLLRNRFRFLLYGLILLHALVPLHIFSRAFIIPAIRTCFVLILLAYFSYNIRISRCSYCYGLVCIGFGCFFFL